jgi:hypothetical protein
MTSLELSHHTKLTEALNDLHHKYSQELTKQQTDYESRLLIERSKLEIMEKKLHEHYEMRSQSFITSAETTKQNFQNKIQILEMTIEKYQEEIEEKKKNSEKIFEEKNRIIERLEQQLKRSQSELRSAERERSEMEYHVITSQELSALVISLYRHGRVRTTDEYNTEELYRYLMKNRHHHAATGRRMRGGEEEEDEEDEEYERTLEKLRKGNKKKKIATDGIDPQEQEMIVPLETVKKAYEISKVSVPLCLCHHRCLNLCSESSKEPKILRRLLKKVRGGRDK